MDPLPVAAGKGKRSWFRWCLRWLLRGTLGFGVLIVLFYLEEDWRGANAWSKAEAELKAQGISLDPQTYIPPPVPDAENFGAMPFFRTEKVDGYLRMAISKDLKAVNSHLPYTKETGAEPGSLPYLGNWLKGESPDLPAVQARLEAFCRQQMPGTDIPPEAKLADIFGMVCPVLADMRAANATHPQCRFGVDYAIQPSWDIPLGPITDQIQVAKILSYEERLALLGGQPDLALDDLKVAWKINAGLAQEPFLVSGLVSLGVVAIHLGAVNEGLAKHAWNDQQLAALDDDLGKMDCLSENQRAVRGDTVMMQIPAMDYTRTHRRVALYGILIGGIFPGDQISWNDWLGVGLCWLIPSGWIDTFKADSARFNLLEMPKMVDPAEHRVYPDREGAAFAAMDKAGSSETWRNFVSPLVRPTFNSVKKYAYEQVQVDEARISCRLERYRLAQGTYPSSLAALVPAYGAELPHDVMNGEPYRYKLNGDGTYLLYSVGWDQKDGGGQLGSKSPYHTSDNLDWIWTNYPDQRKAK